LAFRLSTAGSAVFDGNGLALSVAGGGTVHVSVGVIEAVCVPVGAGEVFVSGANAVSIGRLVWTSVDGAGIDVRLQANEFVMPRSKITSFRLIGQICSPSRIIYSNDREVKKFLYRNKYPRRKTGILNLRFPVRSWD
jgi:hypothetical protein